MEKEDNELRQEIKKLYEGKYQSMSGDEVAIYILEQLKDGTTKLNRLTITLICLTVVLAALAVVQILKCL